jgi:hypothetical protein
VFVIHLANGENRWNTTFVREIAAALDDVEAAGGGVDGKGPAALAFCSDDPKFFSNGLDLAWMTAKGRDEQDALGGPWKPFNPEVMALFARIMTNPIPTLAAVGGHCFGAGMMLALCCDAIFMREDRGNMCANEVELGFAIPEPELALFRHKLPVHALRDGDAGQALVGAGGAVGRNRAADLPCGRSAGRGCRGSAADGKAPHAQPQGLRVAEGAYLRRARSDPGKSWPGVHAAQPWRVCVWPRLTARKSEALGVEGTRSVRLHTGMQWNFLNTGVFCRSRRGRRRDAVLSRPLPSSLISRRNILLACL